MGVAPRQTSAVAAPLLCRDGSQLATSEVRRSYHRPGESEPHLECIASDGTRRNGLLPAIGAVLGLAFLGSSESYSLRRARPQW
ncbi:MAG: hypothetical protein A2Y93_10355 [Chloroflexi bacterium RBG_13_68_17]|nr:MAG: hypothetical protein A2Y93_10355 [Chloroflexi bacterium RBG_13_68_17]